MSPTDKPAGSNKASKPDDNTSRKRKASDAPPSESDKFQYVAVDCEFVGVEKSKKSALGRCSIVNYWGEVVLDIYSVPDERITDFRTPWSGIRSHHMKHAIPFENARNVAKVILKDKIVIGHAVDNDLRVLRIDHLLPDDMIRDTSNYEPLKQMAKLTDRPKASLKALSQALLGRTIQTGEHDSVEDARATMDLYKKVEERWEAELAAKSKGKRRRMTSESTSYLDDSYWPDDDDDEE